MPSLASGLKRPVLTCLFVAACVRGREHVGSLPCELTATDSSAILTALRSASDHRTEIGSIASLCKHKAAVVVAWMPSRDDSTNYGPRLVMLRRGKRWDITQIQNGMRDATPPAITELAVDDRTLLVADLVNEGSWGLGVFEIQGDTLASRGVLDIGLPPSFPSDPDESAIRHVAFSLVNGRWRATLDTTIVLEPNQQAPRRRVLEGPGPHVFERQASEWRRVQR